MKIKDKDEKMQMLINMQFWEDAVRICFQDNMHEYLDEISYKGPSYIK